MKHLFSNKKTFVRSRQNLRMLVIAGVLVVTAAACTKSRDAQPNIEPIQDMMDQPALKAQDYEPSTPDEDLGTSVPSERLPPVGTLPQGYKPYAYHLNATEATKNLKNPLSGDLSPQVIELGRKKYNTLCIVCHGPLGHGDGLVAAKMSLKPPPLISDKIMSMPDAGIFHIISDGQGVMASYAYQLPDERDRWAVVNYVRSLQKLSKESK